MMSPVIHSAHAVLVKNTNGATEIRETVKTTIFAEQYKASDHHLLQI
jgi:hypothetical protein